MTNEPAGRPGFLRELRRRKVLRVGGAYAVVAFVVLQAGQLLFGALLLPDWTFRLVAAVLILGFPVALALAWAFDITPEGVVRTGEAEAAGGGARRTGRWHLAAVLAIGFAVAAAGFAVYVRGGPDRAAGIATADATDASIAVLPFVDMSPARDQEYFSDGITEELLNALANVPGLRVPARTSSFAFKGENIDVRDIGRRLGVAAVLEGSVRRAGDRLRISAQLIDVADGYHVWSDTYDRELTDVFAIQDEIARAIVDALLPRLGAVPADGRESAAGTRSVEAHDAYLLGLHHWHRRSAGDLRRAIELFARALEADPAYARAHAGVALAWAVLPFVDPTTSAEALRRGKPAALRALELDASLPEAHAALGQIAAFLEHDWPAANRHYRRALDLNPNYATAHQWHAELLTIRGRLNEALDAIRIAEALDPMSIIVQHVIGAIHFFRNDFDDAERNYLRVVELASDLPPSHVIMWRIRLGSGRYDEALEALAGTEIPGLADLAAEVNDGLRDPSRRAAALQAVRAIERLELGIPLLVVAPYVMLGDVEAAFDALEEEYMRNNPQVTYFWLDPIFGTLREHPRYISLVGRLRLPEALSDPVM